MNEPPDPLKPLTEDVKSSWHAFLDVFEPLRPELYRYCRHLTRSPWEAEDLVQEVLMRAFVTLGTLFRDVPNPRAWLFRVASNLWIDRVRRSRFESVTAQPSGVAASSGEGSGEGASDARLRHGGLVSHVGQREDELRETREAAGTLLVHLSPQERAAVVLVIAEVCTELEVPYRVNGYRYWPAGS